MCGENKLTKQQYWLAATALVMGILLRVWLLLHHPDVNGDSFVYGDIAKNWLQHGVYGQSDGAGVDPTLIRLPGYPAVITVCFKLFGVENYFAVLVMQIIFDLLSCVLLAATAQRLFGQRAGMATLSLSALCIFTATYAVVGLAESLSIFCIAWASHALVYWRECLLSKHKLAGWIQLVSLSIALIVCVLLRPDNGLLAAALLPAVCWIAWRNVGWKQAAACIGLCTVIFLLPLVPWTIRNYRVFGVFQPLAPRQANDPDEFVTVGYDRWYSTWGIDYASTEDVYWSPQINAIDINDLPARAFDSAQQRAQTVAVITEYNRSLRETGMGDPPEVDAKFAALAQQRIRQHRLECDVLLPIARLLNMWLRPRVEQYDFDLRWWEYSEHPQETLIAIALGAVNLGYLVLAGMGWRRAKPHDAVLWSLAAFVILRSLLLLTLDNSEPRYTIECFPILFLFGGVVLRKNRE